MPDFIEGFGPIPESTGKPAGTTYPGTILKRILLEKIPVKRKGRELKFTKLEVFVEQIINDAMKPDYVPVLFLFRHAGLGRKLEERIRERDQGMSHETANQIRALLGGDL